jgi:tRNA A-37 threonylcarbamoyl transferase component Bud32
MEPKADATLAETVALPNLASDADPEISRATGADSEDEGRFLPGTLLGGRYRILTLLGRGGMGEVYRAMDLTLGQSVALKFLPPDACRNQRLLERFHGEVRVARLVSHPNVCRVFDIGQIEGMPFISMEYVDGEDLASLLTRIGRLPADKAVETARKLCAGLAAAHDRGVIHRDLKPQNIMINKRGEVVIMDFGLAAIANELSGAEVRNGTPAYMSPEQIKGTGVSAKSDLYSLGLVLYELFTGKRPFDAQSLQRLIDMQEALQLTSMTSVAADIDPAVEKIVRRCLDPDPAKRPSSALMVLAALPGGDPLAAALAAGETPSPAMVAAAGKVEGMPLRYSAPCLALAILFLLATIPLRQVRTGMVHGGLDQSPDVLAHQGREIAASFGHAAKPADHAIWLDHRPSILSYLRSRPRPHDWENWLAWEPAVKATYRESPQPMVAESTGDIDGAHPPQNIPGMARVILDGNGRLLDFAAVPRDTDPVPAQPVSPEAVFRAARLDMATFSEATPWKLPEVPFDQRLAWKGAHPHFPEMPVQVEAAWWKGRIVSARVLYPGDQKPSAGPAPFHANSRDIAIDVLVAIGAFFGVLLARRNWSQGRADRTGAFHIALASFLLQAVAWAGGFHPVASLAVLDLFTAAVAEWLLGAAVLWFAYLALEPAIRARWPHSIVTWNRVLAGRWLDAQVGSHILIGAAVGSGLWAGFKAATLFTNHEPGNWDVDLRFLMGARQWVGAHAANANTALSLGLFVFLTIFAARRLLRNELLAAIAAGAMFTFVQGEVAGPDWWQSALLFGAVMTALIFVLLRLGLVATIVALLYVNAVNGMALGTDWSAWYVPASLATLVLLVGIAVFAFWRSLGTRELIEGEAG